MIKRLLILLPCILAFVVSSAQNKFTPEWNVGVGFGPTFSSVSFVGTNKNTTVDTKMLQQFHGGVAVRYITEKNLGIIGELNFSQQGWEEKFEEGIESKSTHKLNYLELPILTHIYFGNKTRFYLNIGPKFSFLMGEKETSENVPFNGSLDEEGNVVENQYGRDAEKKFDYGLVAGLGMEFRSKIGNFSLEGRYSFSFADIYNSHKTDVFSRSANRVISARLTYYVKLF